MTAPETETYAAWVCVDCYAEHHGVLETYDGDRAELLSLIPADADVAAGLLASEHEADCPNHGDWQGAECECEQVAFTWSPCDGCGSPLGGAREALTVWTREETTR